MRVLKSTDQPIKSLGESPKVELSAVSRLQVGSRQPYYPPEHRQFDIAVSGVLPTLATKEVNRQQVKLKLSTVTSRATLVSSQRVDNLQVRGFCTNKKILLPPVYTQDFIPANRTHIPTDETAKAWSHLEHLQGEIAHLQDCEVGLLIGYNCSQALLPREVMSGKENQPYAQHTELRWSIVGHSNSCLDYRDTTVISHRIVVRQVSPGVEPSVISKLKYTM